MTPDAEARQAVADLLHRYAAALDLREWEDLHHVFTLDATADFGPLGGVREGPEAIIRFVRRALEPFAAVQHFITNVVVGPGDGGLSSRSYFLAVHVRAGEGEPFVVGGAYRDRVVATEAGWRIASRTLVPLWQR